MFYVEVWCDNCGTRNQREVGTTFGTRAKAREWAAAHKPLPCISGGTECATYFQVVDGERQPVA